MVSRFDSWRAFDARIKSKRSFRAYTRVAVRASARLIDPLQDFLIQKCETSPRSNGAVIPPYTPPPIVKFSQAACPECE